MTLTSETAGEPAVMTALDRKINEHFLGLVVRKDLVKTVKGNAVVPSYVLEYLLAQYCASDDEQTIQEGIGTVREILRRHYVHRNEAGLVQSVIRENGRHRVIDRISVRLNDKTDAYEATFANLQISGVLVDANTVKAHPKLLVSGVWCIAEVGYIFSGDSKNVPWTLESLKPIQQSSFDFEGYKAARAQFTTTEWIDVLLQSLGLNPAVFGEREKLHQLIRLVPFCERNHNLIELGPKGTGKSHVYSEFSPHGMLISGGEVTVPKLFVNNATGKIGLVGYWDVVAFDEFAGKKKRADKALVDIMKNYMANKSFSRGTETLGAEASMAFVGNTDHTVPYMLKHSDLFDALPEQYHDSAFLDRLHHYVPGWEVDVIRAEMFSNGFGFVVDYLAEILRHLREYDYSDRYQQHFTLSDELSTRDRDGINKTFSGLMKLLHPDGEADPTEMRPLLELAMEGRKRVKDQLLRIDATYPTVRFAYYDTDGGEHSVTTLEETEYPNAYYSRSAAEDATPAAEGAAAVSPSVPVDAAAVPDMVTEHAEAAESAEPMTQTYKENQRGVSYRTLFAGYLAGASIITIVDPYIQSFYQQRNLMEFLHLVSELKQPEDEVEVRLTTLEQGSDGGTQEENFEEMAEASQAVGIRFTWDYDEAREIHDRTITTDTGWRIILGRGLDIFQPYDARSAFGFAARLQEHRKVRGFNITYTLDGE